MRRSRPIPVLDNILPECLIHERFVRFFQEDEFGNAREEIGLVIYSVLRSYLMKEFRELTPELVILNRVDRCRRIQVVECGGFCVAKVHAKFILGPCDVFRLCRWPPTRRWARIVVHSGRRRASALAVFAALGLLSGGWRSLAVFGSSLITGCNDESPDRN